MRNKNIAITILIAIAFMSVAVLARSSQSAPKGQQWEYTVHYVGNTPDDKKSDFLNGIGREGWELVSVYDGRAYFKRPLN